MALETSMIPHRNSSRPPPIPRQLKTYEFHNLCGPFRWGERLTTYHVALCKIIISGKGLGAEIWPFLTFMLALVFLIMDISRYMEVYEGTWRYMEVYEGIWEYVEVHVEIWRYIKEYGGIWKYMVVYGSIWRHMGVYAVYDSIWRYMGVYAGIWRCRRGFLASGHNMLLPCQAGYLSLALPALWAACLALHASPKEIPKEMALDMSTNKHLSEST